MEGTIDCVLKRNVLNYFIRHLQSLNRVLFAVYVPIDGFGS